MVQGINQKSDVFAHITADIVGALQQFGSLVYQICGQDTCNESFLISLIELLQAIGEQAKSGEYKDTSGFAGLQFPAYFKYVCW